MKILKSGALGASLLLLAGCASQYSTTATSKNAAKPAAVPKPALSAGINRSNMDTSVRPQDDFYDYVNGGWLKTAKIPADKVTIGSFYDLRDASVAHVKSIIESLSTKTDLKQGSDEQKVADLFRSYMNTAKLESLGVAPIQTQLRAIRAAKNTDDLIDLFVQSQLTGGGSPLIFYVGIDAKDSTRYAAHIWQGGLHLPDRDYYLKNTPRFKKLRIAYTHHIAKMYQLAGLKDGAAAAKTILALETKIAKHQWTRVQTRDSEKLYNKYPTSKLSQVSKNINWARFMADEGIANAKDLIINQPDFVKAFGKLLKSVPLRDWKTYLTWQTLDGAASDLTKALDDENFNFYGNELSGQQKQRPRWKRGVAVVNGNLGEVVGKIYVKRYFKPAAKVRMRQLVENLRNAYKDSIDNLEWMSATTKKAAEAKLDAFTPKVGYPDKWEDYSKLTIKADDLIGNLRRSTKVAHQLDLERLAGPIRKWEWGMTPQTVNAYYSPTRNEIVFPAAILQPPFFNMNADDAVNYGGIGAVIGHEMGHGFDDQGSRYDAKGNLSNWWTKNDLKEFKKRTAKLVAQYNGYQVFPDLHVNGKLTLGENIGDLSGITIAYRAYKESLHGHKAPIIDGLTGDQRFFIGFAQIWRNKIREKSLRNRVNTDPHSPGKFRALGALSNMPQFYSTFGVKKGDKMYISPKNRVKIW